MPSYEDYAPRLSKFLEKNRRERLARHRNTVMLGEAASGIRGDPRWAPYANRIEAMRQRSEGQASNLRSLLFGERFLRPEEYGQVKLDLTRHESYAKALNDVLLLIKQLLENAEKAKETMKEESNAEDGGTLGDAG